MSFRSTLLRHPSALRTLSTTHSQRLPTLCLHRPALNYLQPRNLSTSRSTHADAATPNTQPPPPSPTPPSTEAQIYHGPLGPTFRRLKIFSLSSLALSTSLAPFMFIIESSLPASARFALAGIAIGTSGASTGLVSWCGKPYVTSLRQLKSEEKDGANGLELTTLTLTLKPRITRVYDPDFLVETKRPFAKWELAEKMVLPPSRQVVPGTEETVAETLTRDNEVVGRWIVKWNAGGEGVCHGVGDVIRHFNVHEELLPY
ncbi:hypothetical protein BDN72DRAFT_833150 [Pluteus cervinus]|uniref:Uncharacterized protein n=1 Tax=Pluteus cervinus TaxID=181527 RepID=A0ACD3B8J4_9AGAR|nr:hypothetical protein BDN72DRAFT_833150 [Pluteus cervinus]